MELKYGVTVENVKIIASFYKKIIPKLTFYVHK